MRFRLSIDLPHGLQSTRTLQAVRATSLPAAMAATVLDNLQKTMRVCNQLHGCANVNLNSEFLILDSSDSSALCHAKHMGS